MTSKKKHIVLIGFMGSGKSTIARLLSGRLGMSFVDMDAYIEHKEGKKIKNIFNDRGEDYFRKSERALLVELLKNEKPTIISTGGGVPCFYDNIDKINEFGLSIYLKVGRQTLTDRLRADTERPLLQNKTEKDLFRLVDMKLREREGFYNQADFSIRGSNTPEAIVDVLIRLKKKNNK